MLILAHRGLHVTCPENTLAAFAAAAQAGVDGIETDVRLSADGIALLMHDRISPDGHAVSQLTHAELVRACGYAVPRLVDALDAQPTLLWNLEIKHGEAMRATLEVIAARMAPDRFLITSFRHDVVRAMAEALPEIDCGLLCAHRPHALRPLLHGMPPNVRMLVWDFNALDPAIVAQAREAGWRNAAYGAHTIDEHRYGAEIGLDLLITDFPERVRLLA